MRYVNLGKESGRFLVGRQGGNCCSGETFLSPKGPKKPLIFDGGNDLILPVVYQMPKSSKESGAVYRDVWEDTEQVN